MLKTYYSSVLIFHNDTTCSLTLSYNAQQCEGLYRIVDGRIVNGYPLWQKVDGDRWLYHSDESDSSEWVLGGPDEERNNFPCDKILLLANQEVGTMPDQAVQWCETNIAKQKNKTIDK